MLRIVRYGAEVVCRKALFAALFVGAGMAQAKEVTILALGDSLTQGFGLVEADGFVPRLSQFLKDSGLEANVINAGVSGDTTAGGLARVEWSLTPEVNAMIVALGGNDLLRGIDPALVRSNLSGILDVAKSKELPVLLIGMQAPGNYGAEYKSNFDAAYPELAAEFGTLYLESFFAGLLVDGQSPADLAEWMQNDGIHPNAEGVLRIVDHIGPHVLELVTRVKE